MFLGNNLPTILFAIPLKGLFFFTEYQKCHQNDDFHLKRK